MMNYVWDFSQSEAEKYFGMNSNISYMQPFLEREIKFMSWIIFDSKNTKYTF